MGSVATAVQVIRPISVPGQTFCNCRHLGSVYGFAAIPAQPDPMCPHARQERTRPVYRTILPGCSMRLRVATSIERVQFSEGIVDESTGDQKSL